MFSTPTLTTHKERVSSYIYFVGLLPKIISQIDNWTEYLKTYSNKYSGLIRFRDGTKLNVEDASDISSITTSFFRKDYGDLRSNWRTIVDIGAHKGYFTTYAAKECPSANIYSFEPIKTSFQMLSKNIAQNHLDKRVHVFNLGLADKEEVREINLSTSSTDNTFYSKLGSDLNGKTKIKCTTLQNAIENNKLADIDLLKIDCEGAEFEIFMSSNKKTLRHIKEIRMEYHNIDKKKNITKLISFFKKAGLKLVERRRSNNPKIGYARFVRV